MPDRRRRPRRAAPAPPELPAGPVPTSTATAELRQDGPGQVTLLLDGTEASGIDLADPAQVPFEYMQHMLAVLDAAHPGATPVRALHLGGAGCALARAVEARRPGSTQLAVEIDAELARLVREWFDLPRSPRLRIRTGDARAVLGSLTGPAWDLVVRDVFAGGE
ncbi:fused MFS/spermidine synthase, partial [Georgenia sp. 10Sc9-8]|nr:fused MFS/spermidine synthase [Georgenia halotolerans]